MPALDAFAAHLQCTGLEARDMAEKAEAFVALLVKLQAAYTTEHLDRTIRLSEDIKDLHAKRGTVDGLTTWQELKWRKIRASVGSGPKTLWAIQRDAEAVHHELEYGREVFDLSVSKDGLLTALIEGLHAAKRLPNPNAVAQGRDIYDRLNTHYHHQLTERLGLALPWEQRL